MNTLPLVAENPETLPRDLCILLLEDSELDAELTCASLGVEESGCKMERVEDQHSFESALANRTFDLILADYSLPSFDGITALEIAQRLTPATPFIFVSGALGEELAIETLKRGATDYVLKHRLERLRPSVLRALREQEEKRHREEAEQKLRELAQENARLYEKAQRANVAKDAFIAMISHELRTPMTSILGWTRMLKMGGLSEDEYNAALEAVERSASVQARLIDDLLDLSRISTGKLDLQLESVDLRHVIASAVGALRIPAEEKAITLVSEVCEELCIVRGDRNRLQQVVSNLLQNAVKFTPEGGRIGISMTCAEGYAEICVRDNGMGIRPEVISHIFDAFRQDEMAMAEGKEGLGLGLSIVRHIAERHGGSVAAESDGPGRGATFRVRLPVVCETAAAPAQRAGNEMPDLRGKVILVVEDDIQARTLLATILARCGAKVQTAESVPEAISVLPHTRWNAIISDIAMPGADGYSLMAHIRESFSDHERPPVMAVTAFGSPQDRKKLRAAGFTSNMTKPIDPVAFAERVAALFK